MKFRLVYIVHGVVFLLLLFCIIKGFYEFHDYYSKAYSFPESFNKALYNNRIGIVFLLLLVIGVFLKNKTGWVFLTTYFYFVLWFLLFSINQESLNNFVDIVFFLSFVLVVAILLIIMNLEKVSFGFYKIDKNNSYGINIISCTLGLCVLTLLFLSKNIYFLNL